MRITKISALSDPYYDYVREGQKEWELRLNVKDWRSVKKGDALLLFRHGGKGEFLIVEVLERREYSSFREALEDIGVKRAIPRARSIDKALDEYRRFYSEKKERKHGVVAFRVRTVAEYHGEIHANLLLKYLPHLKEEC